MTLSKVVKFGQKLIQILHVNAKQSLFSSEKIAITILQGSAVTQYTLGGLITYYYDYY